MIISDLDYVTSVSASSITGGKGYDVDIDQRAYSKAVAKADEGNAIAQSISANIIQVGKDNAAGVNAQAAIVQKNFFPKKRRY